MLLPQLETKVHAVVATLSRLLLPSRVPTRSRPVNLSKCPCNNSWIAQDHTETPDAVVVLWLTATSTWRPLRFNLTLHIHTPEDKEPADTVHLKVSWAFHLTPILLRTVQLHLRTPSPDNQSPWLLLHPQVSSDYTRAESFHLLHVEPPLTTQCLVLVMVPKTAKITFSLRTPGVPHGEREDMSRFSTVQKQVPVSAVLTPWTPSQESEGKMKAKLINC